MPKELTHASTAPGMCLKYVRMQWTTSRMMSGRLRQYTTQARTWVH